MAVGGGGAVEQRLAGQAAIAQLHAVCAAQTADSQKWFTKGGQLDSWKKGHET